MAAFRLSLPHFSALCPTLRRVGLARMTGAPWLAWCALTAFFLPFQHTRAADFVNLNPPVPTQVPAGKIEVIEFFWYGCPHCYALEQQVNNWAKQLPADVVFRRVHASLPGWEPHAKIAVVLGQMGLLDALNGAVLDAVHRDRLPLHRPDDLFQWVGKQQVNGKPVDVEQFKALYNSFGMQAEIGRLKAQTEAARIDGVPAFLVGGHFITSPSLAGSERGVFAVLDRLIDQSRRDSKQRTAHQKELTRGKPGK